MPVLVFDQQLNSMGSHMQTYLNSCIGSNFEIDIGNSYLFQQKIQTPEVSKNEDCYYKICNLGNRSKNKKTWKFSFNQFVAESQIYVFSLPKCRNISYEFAIGITRWDDPIKVKVSLCESSFRAKKPRNANGRSDTY